jgi:type II secretory pathway pseudopilin PulG
MRRGFALIEVVIAGIVLAIGLSAVVSVAARALADQQRGEHAVAAATLLDGLLAQVLVDGPVDYVRMNGSNGRCPDPWEDFEYEVRIEDATPGDACDVLAIVRDPNGREYRCATRIAPRVGNEPAPERRPPEPVDRDGRWTAKRTGGASGR